MCEVESVERELGFRRVDGGHLNAYRDRFQSAPVAVDVHRRDHRLARTYAARLEVGRNLLCHGVEPRAGRSPQPRQIRREDVAGHERRRGDLLPRYVVEGVIVDAVGELPEMEGALAPDVRRRVAADECARALELNPKYGWAALQLAHAAALLRDFPRATEAARRAIELQEAFLSGREGALIVGAHTRLGQIEALTGRHEEALEEFGREMEFLQKYGHALKERHFVEIEQRIGGSLLALGRKAAATEALETALDAFGRRLRMGADDPFTRYYAACASALLGRADEALAHLEKAMGRRPALTAARAAIEPDLAVLRGNPRFGKIFAQPAA